MTTLVTGGAGYIGRHLIRLLRTQGRPVALVDLPETEAEVGDVPFLGIDLADARADVEIARFARRHHVDAIVHLAARKRVDESIRRPEWYYSQNVGGLENVLKAAAAVEVGRIVFSSTAAVYASSESAVDESAATAPANPYGDSKLRGERLLATHVAQCGSRAISLRYFNVAGAHSAALAERHPYNLIPLVIDRLATGERPVIYGNDYNTTDGTCVRDFIHVEDLAEAHLVALDALAQGPAYRVYNVGTGSGASVRQVVERLSAIAGVDIAPRFEPRRTGDPAIVVADPSRIRAELGWEAKSGLDEILRSAWESR